MLGSVPIEPVNLKTKYEPPKQRPNERCLCGSGLKYKRCHGTQNGVKIVPKKFFKRNVAPMGRNNLCPCGSGKKFKRCCQPLQQGFEVSPTGGFQKHITHHADINSYCVKCQDISKLWGKDSKVVFDDKGNVLEGQDEVAKMNKKLKKEGKGGVVVK